MKSRKEEEKRHELKVGITIFIGLGLLIFAILYVGEHRGLLQQRYRLHTLMSRVNGLQTGAPVELAGVRVGSVVKVEFSEDIKERKIEVVLEIDKSVQPRIRSDSGAHIGTLGLLGDKYVGITMGTLDHPMLMDGDLLDSSDPLDVEQLLDEGVAVFGHLKNTIASVNEIVQKINEGRGTLGLMINDPRMYYDLDRLLILMENLSEKVDKGEGTLARIFQDSTLFNNMNELLLSGRQLADSLTHGSGTSAKMIQDASLYNELNTTVIRLNSLLEKIDSGEGSFGQVVGDRQLYQNLYRVIAELDSLIKDVRKHPDRYLKVEIF